MPGIAVLGMGRSGTSFLTEWLARSGVYVNGVNWAWEHTGVREVNDEILARHAGAVAGRRPYGDSRQFSVPPVYETRAATVIRSLEEGRVKSGLPYWAIKDPRITLLELWLEHVDVVLGIFRHAEEVAASYVGHRFVSGDDGYATAMNDWLRFNRILVELYARQTPTMYLLSYGPELDGQLEILAERLGLAADREFGYRADQRHYHQESDIEDQRAKAVFESLQQCCADCFHDSRVSTSTGA